MSLEVKHLTHTYSAGSAFQATAVHDVSLTIEDGEFVCIVGHTGSGKSTLVQHLNGLLKPTSGQVLLNGQDLTAIPEGRLAAFRRENLGFVFQDFNLLDTFSLQDNILLPLVLAGVPYGQMQKRLQPLAAQLGLTELLKKFPYEVSGGQKQRAAAARALITHPQLILADEPTGALDSRSSDELLKLFTRINEGGQTIIMVTHSVRAASRAGRVLFIRDGRIFHQLYRGACSDEQQFQRISDTLTMLQTGGERHA